MTKAAGVGTPCMWAPELWLADECDGHKLDTWACGLIIYQLVVGASPFDGLDFEQELDATVLVSMSETISDFGRQAGSAAGPPLPDSSRDLVLSPELRQVLGGLLHPDPGPRFSAADAMQQAWCHAECSASAAKAKVAAYEASSLKVRGAVDRGLRARDPNQWVERRGTGDSTLSQPDRQSLVPLSQAGPEEAADTSGNEGESELDAVQAEIAKLKAEMGL